MKKQEQEVKEQSHQESHWKDIGSHWKSRTGVVKEELSEEFIGSSLSEAIMKPKCKRKRSLEATKSKEEHIDAGA